MKQIQYWRFEIKIPLPGTLQTAWLERGQKVSDYTRRVWTTGLTSRRRENKTETKAISFSFSSFFFYCLRSWRLSVYTNCFNRYCDAAERSVSAAPLFAVCSSLLYDRDFKKIRWHGADANRAIIIIIIMIRRDYARYCCLKPFYLYKSRIRTHWSVAREAAGLFLEPGFVSSLLLLNHKHGITQTGKGVCVCACVEIYIYIYICVSIHKRVEESPW